MKIPVLHLKDGDHRFAGQLVAKDAEAERYPFPINVEVQVNRSGAVLGCSVTLETTARYVCDRCVEPYETPLNELFHQILQVGEDLLQTTEEDVINVPNETVEYDFAERVFEQLLLSEPMKMICREDCAGICAECGEDADSPKCECGGASIDPRWNKLKELLK